MQQHVLLYINQGLKAQLRTFSPPVIIEDQHLQTFLHSLVVSEGETVSDMRYPVAPAPAYWRALYRENQIVVHLA